MSHSPPCRPPAPGILLSEDSETEPHILSVTAIPLLLDPQQGEPGSPCMVPVPSVPSPSFSCFITECLISSSFIFS